MLNISSISDIKIVNNILSNSFINKKSELLSFYDPNSYSSSSLNISNSSNNSDSSISSFNHDDDIISSSYESRLSKITNNTIKSNDIYERQNYVEFIIKQNTYLNNTKYQKLFNQIIFNFKL